MAAISRVVVYSIPRGDCIVLTSPVILSNVRLNVSFRSAMETTLIHIPNDAANALIRHYPELRRDIDRILAKRLELMINKLQAISFFTMEERILSYLREIGDGGPLITTHEEIALDNGTRREVVSRCLESLEKKGLLKKERGMIELV